MKHFECFRCGYNTNNMDKFDKHLNRKKKCVNIYGDITIDYMIEYYETQFSISFYKS